MRNWHHIPIISKNNSLFSLSHLTRSPCLILPSVTMSNPPPIDTAAYTFDTSITPSMYEQLLHQHAKTGITLILAKYNLSLRTRNKHNIFYAFPNEDSKTAKDYIIILDGLLFFLKRVGDHHSLLALHPQAPCECPSASPKYISLYYKYRMCARGSVLLDSDNQAILDVITHKPIRCVGTWKSYSSAEKLNSALRKAHDCIDQSGKYTKKCINCFTLFNNNNNDYNTLGCLQHQHNRNFFNEMR